MKILGYLIMVLGVVAGLYVGGWLMFIQPILYACACFDAGTLTGMIIGVTILKCIFAGAVCWGLSAIGMVVGSAIVESTWGIKR